MVKFCDTRFAQSELKVYINFEKNYMTYRQAWGGSNTKADGGKGRGRGISNISNMISSNTTSNNISTSKNNNNNNSNNNNNNITSSNNNNNNNNN